MSIPDFAFVFRGLEDDVLHASSRPALVRDQEGSPDVAFAVRLVAGDASAFDELFRHYFPSLVAYVRRFVDSADTAEDLAQDALIQLWEIRATVRPGVSLVPLLRTIVRRAALKQLRHLRVVRDTYDMVMTGDEDARGPRADAALDTDDVMRAVRAAVMTLPPRIRLVATMRWLDELGRQEIATELGVSVRTVDAQLYQAAVKIRAALRPYQQNGAG
jgi:RNA polymerase sigma-70 factor (ECF subfamily)